MATIKELKQKSREEQEDFVNTEELERLEQELNRSNGIKLTETEIRLLTDLNRKKELVTKEINYLAQQRLNIDYRQEEAEKLYRSNLELERQLGTQFTEKYGNGTIDIDKGIFIPS
jgi:hypothetical protein